MRRVSGSGQAFVQATAVASASSRESRLLPEPSDSALVAELRSELRAKQARHGMQQRKRARPRRTIQCAEGRIAAVRRYTQ